MNPRPTDYDADALNMEVRLIANMEVRYQGRWNATMLADYCWSIKHDDTGASHSRKSVKRQFMADDVYA